MRVEHTLPAVNEKADATKRNILALHESLARHLAEMHGESLTVERADHIVEGNTAYQFDDVGCRCVALVEPLNERAVAVTVTARVGRLYREFPRALRWLAFNRAGSSVGLCCREEYSASRELWVATNRVTLPDDDKGVRETLLDVRIELLNVRRALGCNFPQIVHGARLAGIEKVIEAEGSEGLAAMLACPRGFLDAVERDAGLLEQVGLLLAIEVAAWVCDWEKHLKWIDEALNVDGDEKPGAELRLALLGFKLGALARLRRHEDCLRLADEYEKDSDESERDALPTLRCHALYGLGRYDEMLETVRSATLDGNPRVWFWRSLAYARLGEVDEATTSYMLYEQGFGADIIGGKELRKAMPSVEMPKKEDPPAPDLEIKL